MQLRRFTGDSMPAALGAVRQALGDEAIILSNRQVDGRIEIVATAMLDESALAAAEMSGPATIAPVVAARASANAALHVPSPEAVETSVAPAVTTWAPACVPGSGASDASTSGTASGSAPVPTRGPAAESGSAPEPDPTPVHDFASAPVPLPASTSASTFGSTVEPTPESTFDASAVAASVTDSVEALFRRAERHHEARAGQLRDRFRHLEVNLWSDVEPVRATHLRQLLRLGIGAELGVSLAEGVTPGSAPEGAMRRSLARLKESLPVVADGTGIEPGVTVLSGPAGGGKSTALVKLATRQVQREGAQSLVMIAADNRRIGAFESLQAYGRLLGVSVVQARDGDELASLIEAFSHKSLVLVDHVPPERRETMPLPAPETLGTHAGEARRLRHLMVLPATLESRAFEALVARHRELGVTAAVLTQLDRSARLGTCLAPLLRHRLGIAYWSDNARVQTPLEKANASVLVAAVMSTGGRLAPSVDEALLLDLVQPTRRDVGGTLVPGGTGGTVDGHPINSSRTAMTAEITL